MDIQIEKYDEKDIPGMLAIWNKIVEDGHAFPQEETETEESAKKFFAAQSFCAVARVPTNGEIVGLYILHPNNVGRCAHIANASYGVAENARNRGVGRLLVKDSLLKARQLGFKIMQFNAVTSDNTGANTLYKSLGFQSLGTVPNGFRRPGGELVDINLYYKIL